MASRIAVCGLVFLLVVAPLGLWTLPVWAQAGIYLEFTLPDGSSYRFGPLVLERGDMVAPGFYKLVLDGSGYVEFNTAPTAGTIAALARPYKTPDWNAIVSNDEALSWRLYVSQVSDAYEFMRRDNASNTYVVSDGLAADGELAWIIAYTYSDRLEIHAASVGSTSWPGSPASPTSKVLIGSNMFNGVEQSPQRWTGEIWSVVIHSQPGIDPRSFDLTASGLELLFDPSWFDRDANTFIALTGSGTIEGVLNGTAVLEASEPRVWIIRGAYSDQFLHVSMAPYGSRLRILDVSGAVLAEYTVIGESRGGLVIDYPVPWPPPLITAGEEGLEALDLLAVPVVMLGMASPLIAASTGLMGGVFSTIMAGVAGWLSLAKHAEASGAEKTLWLGLGVLNIVMLILSIAVVVYRLYAILLEGRGLREPPGPV